MPVVSFILKYSFLIQISKVDKTVWDDRAQYELKHTLLVPLFRLCLYNGTIPMCFSSFSWICLYLISELYKCCSVNNKNKQIFYPYFWKLATCHYGSHLLEPHFRVGMRLRKAVDPETALTKKCDLFISTFKNWSWVLKKFIYKQILALVKIHPEKHRLLAFENLDSLAGIFLGLYFLLRVSY